MLPLKLLSILMVPLAAGAADPKKAQHEYENGLRYEQAGRMQEAYWSFSQALAADPTEQAYLHRAKAQLALGATEKAIDDLSHAWGLDPKDPEPLRLRGELYAKKGERAKAVEDLSKAIELGAPSSSLYSTLGNLREQMGQHQAAAEDFSKAIKLRLDDAEAWKGRGIAVAALGRYGDAIDDFDQ